MSEYVEGYSAEQIKEWAEINAAIPDAEILQDIADTEREIFQMEREIPGHEILADAGDKMEHMRLGAKRSGVAARKAFIVKLNLILEYRKQK